jgi:hypothetical protein
MKADGSDNGVPNDTYSPSDEVGLKVASGNDCVLAQGDDDDHALIEKA